MRPAYPQVIQLEFNELSPALMDRFIGQGHLPNFKKMRDESLVYTTEAAERAPYLDPWIQWVTVHTGLDFGDHGVEQLDEGHKLVCDRVWDLVSRKGWPVWVCGSMSTAYQEPLNGYLMPDPWTTHVKPYPDELVRFFSFVQRNVQEYSNDRVPLGATDYANFVAFLATHGLSFFTATSAVQQLVRERTIGQRWKRAVILDKLQLDVFSHIWRKIKPAFSTFFLNSTAHYQHLYWRNMEADQFRVKPTEQENLEYGAAILFGYQEMDGLVGRLLELVGDQATLILTTALSQQACVVYEEGGGKRIFRPRRFEPALDFIGVPQPYTVSPVMSNQFHIFFETEEAAQRGLEQLDKVRVMGERAMCSMRDGNRVLTGAAISRQPATDALLEIEGADKRMKFFDLFYQIEGLKSGMHHQNGLFWIRTPQRHYAVCDAAVPLRRVAPTVLELLGIDKPAWMAGESALNRMERPSDRARTPVPTPQSM
jgi:hypothetical protein